MKLTLTDLNAGIYWWLTVKVKWPRDFHNSDYYELYDIRENGLTDTWWAGTVNRLAKWYAIRPKSKAEIEERGLKVIQRMQQIYSGLLDSANDEPVFLNFEWPQISDFYDLLANIKGAKSPVFPSKLGHFLFPKLFMIMDNEATHAQPYDVFWSSMRKAWHDFDERETAKQILLAQIAEQRDREIHDRYPLEIKVIELCSIGRKHKSIQEIVSKSSLLRKESVSDRKIAEQAAELKSADEREREREKERHVRSFPVNAVQGEQEVWALVKSSITWNPCTGSCARRSMSGCPTCRPSGKVEEKGG